MAYKINQFGSIVAFSDKRTLVPVSQASIEALSRARNRQKNFKITSKQANIIRNAAAIMWLERRKEEYVSFGTVTFCEDVKGTIANSVFKLFAKRISRFAGVREYIAVRENTKAGRPHYHILMLHPYVKYTEFNQILCECMWHYNLSASNNCFTTNSRNGSNVVNDINGCVRYVTSYISKSKKSPIAYEEKCYFISNGLRGGKRTITNEEFAVIEANFPRLNEYKSDYFTVINYAPFDIDVRKEI